VIAALLVLLPVGAVGVWAFFRFTPPHAERKAVLRFNVAAVAFAAGGVLAWGVRTYMVMSPTVDAGWWPVISMLGALVVIPAVLGVAAVLRNVVIFRRRAGASDT